MATGAENPTERQRQPGTQRSLTGLRALVTGSTGGLGLAIVEALANAGAGVMMHGLDPAEAMEPIRDSLARTSGSDVAYHRSDLSTRLGVEELVEAAAERLGGIDILVNNAVVRHFAPVAEFPHEAWESALAVNLSAAFYAIRRTLPAMRSSNYGRIFNMTSVYGLRGTANRIGYVATKSALLGVTRAVALENLDRDVTCHCICPGSVLTPGTDVRVVDLMEDQGLDRAEAESQFLEGKQPGGRFVSPASVSDLVVFLCGPVARDMTGALLPVEAGWLVN